MSQTEFDERLIAEVKKRSCLWNCQDAAYTRSDNRPLKEAMWMEIARATGRSESACQTRWKSLRDQMSRFLRSNKEKKQRFFRFQSQLEFVIPSIEARKTNGSVLENSESKFFNDDSLPPCFNDDQPTEMNASPVTDFFDSASDSEAHCMETAVGRKRSKRSPSLDISEIYKLSANEHYGISLGRRLEFLPRKIRAQAIAKIEAVMADLTPDDTEIITVMNARDS